MRGFIADCRHAIRLYVHTIAASLITVVVLAVAMAFVGAFLSLYVDLDVRPHLAFEDGAELVTIMQNFPETRSYAGLSLSLIERMNEEVGSLKAAAGSMLAVQTYQRNLAQQQIPTELVTRQYFLELRPRLHMGRGFELEDHEPTSAPVVVVSYAFWRDVLGEDADVLGSTINIAGPEGQGNAAERIQAYRVIGVMAEGHDGTFYDDVRVWMPFEQAAAFLYDDGGLNYRNRPLLNTLGRLAEGAATPSVVLAELRGRYTELDRSIGLIQGGGSLDVMSGVVLDPNRQRELAGQIRLFLAGTILLALVAAANVSLFLLSRAPGRGRELGIRRAVGASLMRLARQLATEAAVLIGVASVLGVLISVWLAAFVSDLRFFEGARWRDVTTLDWRVLLVVAGLMVVLTVLVALAPVMRLRRLSIAESSRQVSARAGWGQKLAGTVQIMIAAVISSSALAFAWNLVSLNGADRGFDPGDALVVWGQLPPGQVPSEPDSLLVERERKRSIVRALPGVERVGFSTVIPGRLTASAVAEIPVQERIVGGDETVIASLDAGDPEFLEILDMLIVSGEPFETDDQDRVIINEALAHAVWGRTDVAGESIRFVNGDSARLVAGVIGDVSYGHPSDVVLPRVLQPVTNLSGREQIIVDGDLGVSELREAVQQTIDAGDLEFESIQIDRIADLVNAQIAPDRARTVLTMSAAWLVVALAGFGFYGTQGYLVTAGRREYAIRASLGAGPRRLGRLVYWRGFILGLPGLGLGSLLAFIVVAWLRDSFVSREISPAIVTACVAIGLTVILLAASLAPAREAQRTQPATLLRVG